MYKVYIREASGRKKGTKEWYVQLKFKNGRIFMHSEGYKRKFHAKDMAEQLAKALRDGMPKKPWWTTDGWQESATGTDSNFSTGSGTT